MIANDIDFVHTDCAKSCVRLATGRGWLDGGVPTRRPSTGHIAVGWRQKNLPTRILRDGILSSHAVNSITEPAEILYRRLMSIVDDYGRTEADADLIRARCFPLQLDRWPSARIKTVLSELGESPLVTVYHRGNKTYIQIENFGQRLQSKERYPAPFQEEVATRAGSNSRTVDEYKELRRTTVNHGESPLKSESESESESESIYDQKHVADATFTLTTPADPPSPVRPAVPAGPTFEDWWKVWWNKTAKAEAQKAWKQSTHHGAQFLIDQCIADRQRFEGTESWEWRLRLHPATWLRGKRWEDEVSPPVVAAVARAPTGRPSSADKVKAMWAERIARGEDPI